MFSFVLLFFFFFNKPLSCPILCDLYTVTDSKEGTGLSPHGGEGTGSESRRVAGHGKR